MAQLARKRSAGLVSRGDGDVDVVPVDLYWVGGHRLGRRGAGGSAGTQVKTRPVQPALHGVVVDLALGQRDFLVRADVVQGEDLAAGAHQGDRQVADLHPDGTVLGQISQGADPDERACLAHVASPGSRLRVSSASMDAVIRSRKSGTSILLISSPKNPR